jgi:hypothetical protein
MDDIIVLENDDAMLVYHTDKRLVHHTFRRPVGGLAFRQILESGVACLEKYEATKWLSDDRLNSELSADDTTWATHTWFKLAQNAGWKTWALVVPHDIFARLNLIEHVNHYSRRGIRVMVFTDLEQAITWLDGIEN